MTTGEVSARLAEVSGASVSRDTISTITDRVLEGMAEWQSRPLALLQRPVLPGLDLLQHRLHQLRQSPVYSIQLRVDHVHRRSDYLRPGDAKSHLEWTHSGGDTISQFSDGRTHPNFLDGDEPATRAADTYGPKKMARLADLERESDPTNLFHLNKNIVREVHDDSRNTEVGRHFSFLTGGRFGPT